MRTHASTHIVAAALLALAPATALHAQGGAPPPAGPQAAPQLPDSIQAKVQEFQETRQALDLLQDSAMATNPELQADQAEIEEAIRTKMQEMNPEIESHMARMDTLRGEMAEAQQTQDQQRLQGLIVEARRIQQEVQSAQFQAMETESISVEVEAFQEDLLTAMTEIDPEAEEKMELLDRLSAELQAFQRSQEGGPGGPGGS